MTTSNAFIYGINQSIGDTAIAYALTAARWGVLGAEWYYGAFFSPAAKARYQLVGEIVGHCLILAVIGWRMAQQWAEGEVQGAIAAPVIDAGDSSDLAIVGLPPEPLTTEADPFDPTVNPLPVAAVVEALPLSEMSIRQLKAVARGKVPNYGRMTKPQLVEALRAA